MRRGRHKTVQYDGVQRSVHCSTCACRHAKTLSGEAMQGDSMMAAMRQFVQRKLEGWPEFVALAIVGSVAHGEARPDSDIDCIMVFDTLDEAIVPAEFVWVPATDTFHTIFEVEASDLGDVQIDAKRFALDDFRRQEWPEGIRHELAHAVMLFDRNQTVREIISERVAYPEAVRLSRIGDHLGRAEYYLEEWRVLAWIDRGGIAGAHDQLTAAFDEVIQLLHACNREWLPWRYRWMASTQRLSWLPDDYQNRAAGITTSVSADKASVLQRRNELGSVLEEIRDRLHAEGLLVDPDEAFIAAHPGLGYAHNFEAWRANHRDLLQRRGR